MSLQFVLGSSGAGKSHYIYDKVIQESMKNPKTNYILLVPEQYSMALQKKMVKLHPYGGTMNIDVIGFNRLAYRVFDELNYHPKKVLEDFGKTMLIRQVAGSVRKELSVYDTCLDKSGFIDEVKSLMSEMYQYDIFKDKLEQVVEDLKSKDGSQTLYEKLKDMLTIFRAFEARIEEEYIVAEQITGILADMIESSKLIENSVIVLDGFTGFTPIQMKLVSKLMKHAKKVYVVLTMDKQYYSRKSIKEHELFYLTHETRESLRQAAHDNEVFIDNDVFIEVSDNSRWTNKGLKHLEKNIFRYPYDKYEDTLWGLSIEAYDNPRNELRGISYEIKRLVMEEGYRYRDIAVITGNLEGAQFHVKQVMDDYEIPYFLDANIPVKNNPYIDCLEHALNVVKDDFSYDSVFAFLKSGIIEDLTWDEIEKIENFILKSGVRGLKYWNQTWENEFEETRSIFMEIILPFYDAISGQGASINDYVDAVKLLMERLSYKDKMEEGLYDKLILLLDKMSEIMGDEIVEKEEFGELMNIGLKDISLGRIPGTLDMVIVGDITRTRLDDIKVLFVMGVNDGIIPKKTQGAQIINDREKDILQEMGFSMAPTDKKNSFIEQFYLYLNMTKPSDRLCISYTALGNDNEPMRPSYLINRIKNIFPQLEEKKMGEDAIEASTLKSGKEVLISGMQEFMSGDMSNFARTIAMYKYYFQKGEDDFLDFVISAMKYDNLPNNLSKDVADLIKLRLMSQSVSRLEKYAGCAYSYFLQYTLGLRERSVKALDNRNIGNILHSAMERLYRHVHDNLNNDWSAISSSERDELITGFVNYAFENEYSGQIIEEGRYDYIKNMLVRIGKRTAKALCNISASTNLKPEFFEHRFHKNVYVENGDFNMKLTGIVDRGDVYYSDEDKSLKLRIIDYKSGSNEFKINQLYEGLQLQLSVYMSIMLELAKDKYTGKGEYDVVPEGMYYYQMKDPYIEAVNIDDAEKKRDKELKLKGLENTDKETFDAVIEYAMHKAKNLAAEIVEGNINKNPVVKDKGSVCDYCIYSDVCRFDAKYGKNKYHYLRYKDSEKETVMTKIKEELGGKS